MAAAGPKETKRSSIFGRIFGAKGTEVWEVRSDEDLGLDPPQPKNKVTINKGESRRRTLTERPNSDTRSTERRKTIGTTEPLIIDKPGSQFSMRSYGSAVSISTTRSQGSFYSNSSDRARPRTHEGIPPISPMNMPSSIPSVASSERSASKRSSHIQLVPRSMLPADTPLPSAEEINRLEREILVLEAKERRSRGQSSTSVELDRPGSRSGDDLDRPRSDASSNGGTRVRIQYVPRSSLPQNETEHVSSLPVTPLIKPVVEHQTRLRSLTAVTEETRINSEYHSDIEEEDEQEDEEDENKNQQGET